MSNNIRLSISRSPEQLIRFALTQPRESDELLLERIQELKKDHPYLQYHTCHVEGVNRPIIVPDGDMQRFISVCETHDERLLYLSPDEVRLASGTPVKIIGSKFDGVEGTFMRVEGKRKKHVVVCIQGVAAVAIATLEDCYLQPI
jgi:hypothetical protein